MKRKLYAGVGICGIGILASVFIASVNKDDVGPKIELFDNTITIGSDELEISDLLPYVSVVDKKDGDVSDTLMIESTHITESGETAKVILVAMDRSYNVSRVTYELSLEKIDSEKKDSEQMGSDQKEEDDQPSDVQDNQNAEQNTNQDNNDADSNIDETPTDYAVIVEQEIADLPADYPQMRLNTYEITLQKDQIFSYLNYIDSIVDSEDERSYLYAHIHIVNRIENGVSGEYTVDYYAIDSDGNHSNTAVLHVTIP